MRNKRFPKYPDETDYTTNSPSYYDDLARKQKLIQLLAEKIWEYDEELAKRFEAWDKNLEEFPEEVKLLLIEWMEDGTLDHIINETIFNWKADKTYVDSEIERLDQKDENLTDTKAEKTFVDSEIERLDQADENLDTLKADKTVVDSEIERLDQADENLVTQLTQTEIDLRKDIEQHGFNLRWNEHLVVDGDWTQALQQALDDSPDDGRTIFIGQDIRIDSTILWPNITGDTSIMKPCTIQGMTKNRGNGVIDGYQKGAVAIEFTGEGALFDLRNGSDSQTEASVSFRDINLFGQDKEGSIGISADFLRGSNFENMQFRRFDVGMRLVKAYYGTFDNLRFFYNLSYGLNIEGEVNHAKFHRCNFSQTLNGTGVRVNYGQTGVVFDGCWFEGNKTGLSLEYCMQALVQGCYFEDNTNTIDILGHIETGQTTVTIIGSNLTSIEGSRTYPIRTAGDVKYHLTMLGNTFFHWLTEGPLIAGSGDRHVVDINNHTVGDMRLDQPVYVRLKVDGDGVSTNQLNSGIQVGAGLDITDTEKVAKMEVFNRNGDSAGFVQLYKG